MYVTAIIAAGGQGLRFGGERLKQLVEIGAASLLERSVSAFVDHPNVSEVVVALPADLAVAPPAWLRQLRKPLAIVAGGARRQDSVANGLRAASAASEIIVVHDAARPFVTADLIARTIAAAVESGAALAAVPARDTVKRTASAANPAEAGSHGREGREVVETIPRDEIYLAQTPQAFRRGVLEAALALGHEATDEAALAEQAGYTVRIVEGEARNIKVTTPEDLPIAQAIAREIDEGAGRASGGRSRVRIGTGYDLHRLVEGRPLVLGGVTIPFDRGLAGHSDADAICHAVTDAVLGAAAAGDIGRHFPDSDPRWKDASSIDLLRRAAAIVRAAGYTVGNVDVVVIAERPKLGPFVEEMRARVAEALGADVSAVSVKGKTNEGVGELGRGEAVAVHAVAILA